MSRRPFSFDQKRETATLEEAADWFCDNPNYEDIEDELRLMDAEAEARGRQWAINVIRSFAGEAPDLSSGLLRGMAAELELRSDRIAAERRVAP